MAEVVKNYAFKGSGRPTKYPWDKWTDGRTWRAVAGVDYVVSDMAFRSSLYAKSRSTGLRVKVSLEAGKVGSVVFQFIKDT